MTYLIFSFLTVFGASAQSLPATITTAELETRDELNFTYYNPNYLIYGHGSTKIQFSFKYQIVERWNLFFGYTQLMYWDLEGNSKPFRDVNYNPELFHHIQMDKGLLDSIDASPFEHLSNGRDGIDSRSFNRAYVRFNFVVRDESRTYRLAPRLGYVYGVDIKNRDIGSYVGPFDLRFSVTQLLPWILDKGEAYVQVMPGSNWQKGGQELGLSFRVKVLGLNPSLFMQVHNGYAESLLHYSQKETRFRIGFLL